MTPLPGSVPSYLAELFSLDGRVAVVTGGSSGIGRAVAEALARAGARVVIIARDPQRLADAVAALRGHGCQAEHVAADLSTAARVRAAAEQAAAPFGEPDILVNCAGINLRPPLPDLDDAQWEATMDLNLRAPFLLGQRFGPGMAERGWGRIINVASQQAFRAFGNSGAYGASKGGLAALTRSQAEAWSPHGVCCNTLVPGFVLTPLTAEAAADPARVAAMAARTLTGRNGLPEDFAGAAVFLASPAAAAVTGHALFVDGGFAAH
ncbi:gluconate 5-dehydrogenase [Thermomonospora echinospora]|uniref:Gluconate 5-dehydrogenase n=1 Tax=Thermomonospora echinospora TaxID=1992 RepID=A0A1H6DIZ7_9ACTN|nr:SDR family oxidoreductase [Thermomonospora echinospora]SEG84655.1 gluconate 5-dehydrogenase [Thermomonospora echinospora]